MHSADFDKFKQEYTDLLDRITAFVQDLANKLNPPLLDETKKKVKDDFDVLKQHLFNAQGSYFGPHKPEVYGVGKERFHAFETLLQNERIPLQKRIEAVVEQAPRARMCSGGVLSDLQEVTAALKADSHGLQGIAYQWKKKMMEALILEHIKATHDYFPGEEIHFVNAYYNKLADEMGVRKRKGHFRLPGRGVAGTRQAGGVQQRSGIAIHEQGLHRGTPAGRDSSRAETGQRCSAASEVMDVA